MIDIHNHVLYGLDDGAQTLEESIEMCQISFNDGIRTIVATPHTLNGLYQNNRSTILARVQELNDFIRNQPDPQSNHPQTKSLSVNSIPPFLKGGEGGFSQDVPKQSPLCPPFSKGDLKGRAYLKIRSKTLQGLPNQTGLRILPGADVHFSEAALSQIYQEKVTTIADGGKFLLLEFPSQGIPYKAEEVLFDLLVRGITPIISHPERNLEIVNRPQRYMQMVHMGCLGQISAASLKGDFGRGVRQGGEQLLRNHLVHIIASDGHSANGRRPVLSSAVQAAARIVGEEEARRMVTEYPQAILEGRRPNVPEPREGLP